MIYFTKHNSRVLASFVNLSLVFSSLVSCKNSSSLQPTENDSGVQSLFSESKEWHLKLRSGRTIDVKDYKLDPMTSRAIATLIRSNKELNLADDKIKEIAPRAPELSEVELSAIYFYTKYLFSVFSKYLGEEKNIEYRYGLEEADVELMFLATISAVNKLPKYSGDVFFGAKLPEEDYIKILKKGKDYFQDNFTSTSTDIRVAKSFATMGVDKSGYASFVFKVTNSRSGVDISNISRFKREKEVLFPPTRPFKVMKLSKVSDAGFNDNVFKSELPAYEVLLEEK